MSLLFRGWRSHAREEIANTELSAALGALTRGDFSRRLSSDDGVSPEVSANFNTLAKMLFELTHEISRVGSVVGRDGDMTGRIERGALAGGWASAVDAFNALIGDLVRPSTEVARVLTQVASGDLSQKMALEIEGKAVRGEFLRIGTTVNTMVDQLNAFASEVTRVAREVGTEGKLGGQAYVPGAAGTWKDLTDSVNGMASNLTTQVRGIAGVVTAVANGDLSKKLVVETKGEILELKNTVNTMVDQLNAFAGEVTRVAREVGTEGKLGVQAEVRGVSGTWKGLTDSVNAMAGNLTVQLRDVSKVATAIANGDLTQKITVDVHGEILQIKNVINQMVDSLGTFAAEVTRVAREVGTEGKLGGQANVPGVAGTWKDLTDNVNYMARNLTDQVRNIALVTTAVARGNLSKLITVDVKGELLELKNTVNTMVEQLRSFAAEVTRVAKEVGTQGKLGGQANVEGVAGTWKDLTDNVNQMASKLTGQVRDIALVTTAVAKGDLSKKITVDVEGEMLELKNTINTMVEQLRGFSAEVTRVAREVGTEGKLGGQAFVPGVGGTWKDLTDNVNNMASNLTTQVRGIAKVVTAVAQGDLSRRLAVEAKGEIAALAETINEMTQTLGIFAEQVTTVAREVGTEGKLGGQARVPGVAGTWKDLTDSVNSMASNLTTQVRGIVKVVTAVANGDLTQNFLMESQGEIAALADTINTMTATLRLFAEQVTTVAREVGTEGKLGGQAKVPGAAGTWRDLTDNVNQLANNLTGQVRAIADVSAAVTEGDLTRFITVEAQGELLALQERVNQMIANLRETTQKNREQDWLKSNLARFSSRMQGQKTIESVSQLIMSELTPLVEASYGAFFITDESDGSLHLAAGYALPPAENRRTRYEFGEGLIGQCALEKKPISLTDLPPDYLRISSGLGETAPLNLLVLPILFEGKTRAAAELASLKPFSAIHRIFLDLLFQNVGVVLNIIAANMRTEQLLNQSQELTQELQHQSKELTQQQEELKRSNAGLAGQAQTLKASEERLKQHQEDLQQANEQLEEKAALLAERNKVVEQKNSEVEMARLALEEKAAQLALSSRYKSEFLANMSHELRTPLNSLLILARLLSDNAERNLSSKQVEFAKTIHAAGLDLLNLINEVLDLSKIEAGKIEIYKSEVRLADIKDYLERTFSPLAQQKRLEFAVSCGPGAPETFFTEGQRLQQILRNLVSNACKFTEAGKVAVRIDAVQAGDQKRILFSVADTGIGIPKDKLEQIFEAFQQADGTTSRKYGGTGLGLSISRKLADLLGGQIEVESTLGRGSVFTLWLALEHAESTLVDHAPQPDAVLLQDRKEEPVSRNTITRYASKRPSVLWDTQSLRGATVLVVDDDVRNIFAIATVLEANGLNVAFAENGRECLNMLQKTPNVALILMDLMMPEMDGYETMGRIRKIPSYQRLPILALTAKAMKGEREKCIDAGASDYITKPVDPDHLLSVMSHWLHLDVVSERATAASSAS